MPDVKITGRILGGISGGGKEKVRFRPKAPYSTPAVWLPREAIAVVEEPGEFVTIYLPRSLAEEKGLEEFI